MAISSLLTSYRGRNLFLPSHGRGRALPRKIKNLLRTRAGVWDIPELPDIGGPLEKHGEVQRVQHELADLYGAKKCWFGVNGASGLLQAALLSIAKPGQTVLMPRNVHQSIIHACVIGDIRPLIFDLPFSQERGHFLPPTSCDFQNVLDEINREGIDLAALILVNPFYQGYSVDLISIISQFKHLGLPVLVDEAHGTHFACGLEELPQSALSAGADLIVHSLHKSATGLTQTAVLWLQGNIVDHSIIQRSISWLQTTSPSSLLLASCEEALFEWTRPRGIKRLEARINSARKIAMRLKSHGLPVIQNQDPLRLILHTAPFGINGFEADSWFMSQGLIAELPEPGCLTFCLGFSSHFALDRMIRNKWYGLLRTFKSRVPLVRFTSPPNRGLSCLETSCRDAWNSNYESVIWKDAIGATAAELVSPYPPGIPLIVPGDVLTPSLVAWMIDQKSLWPKQIPPTIKIVV